MYCSSEKSSVTVVPLITAFALNEGAFFPTSDAIVFILDV
jgi:hypothetical protein